MSCKLSEHSSFLESIKIDFYWPCDILSATAGHFRVCYRNSADGSGWENPGAAVSISYRFPTFRHCAVRWKWKLPLDTATFFVLISRTKRRKMSLWQSKSGQVTNKMMLVAEVSRRPLPDCENGDPVITMVATRKAPSSVRPAESPNKLCLCTLECNGLKLWATRAHRDEAQADNAAAISPFAAQEEEVLPGKRVFH